MDLVPTGSSELLELMSLCQNAQKLVCFWGHFLFLWTKDLRKFAFSSVVPLILLVFLKKLHYIFDITKLKKESCSRGNSKSL
jgi:hypothetical protein